MRKRSKVVIGAVVAGIGFVGSILGILAYFGITPNQNKPDLEVSFDMKPWGHFRDNDLSTGYRPASQDFNDNLIFTITNVGNLHAKNVNLRLQYVPHSGWLNVNTVNIPIKNNDLSDMTIPVIVKDQTVELIVSATFSPIEYDKLIAAGERPYVYYNVTAENTDEKINGQYYIHMP